MVEITEITDKLIGKKISCIIEGITIKDAEIYKYNKNYYILNNLKNGQNLNADHKKEYKYDWFINNGNFDELLYNDVKDIKLLNTSHIYEVW
jgi:hypothetical protein